MQNHSPLAGKKKLLFQEQSSCATTELLNQNLNSSIQLRPILKIIGAFFSVKHFWMLYLSYIFLVMLLSGYIDYTIDLLENLDISAHHTLLGELVYSAVMGCSSIRYLYAQLQKSKTFFSKSLSIIYSTHITLISIFTITNIFYLFKYGAYLFIIAF